LSEKPVGQVRPSQILWTYGPGALVDLPNLSVVVMGLERWDPDRCSPVPERRLLDAVRRVHGPQVSRLRMPPLQPDDWVDPQSPEARIGVPVRPFPRWLRCTRCQLLAEYDSGLFDIKFNPVRHDRTHYVHTNCEKHPNASAVPARFLLACRNGHLDDFPWHWFVHGGPSSCRGTLRFVERSASLQTADLMVKCDTCGTTRPMSLAFGSEGQENLPACRGRHPHLDRYEECDEAPRSILLGATNGWFPITISVLSIPLEGDQLSQLVRDGWEYFADMDSVAEVTVVVKTLVKSGSLPGIDRYDPEEIWKAIQDKREGDGGDGAGVTESDVKRPEWEVLTGPTPPEDWPHFLSRRTDVPSRYRHKFSGVLLLEKLREVNALIGYSRIEAPEESMDPDERPPMAELTRERPEWVPVSEVHGEGIFIRFDEDTVRAWEDTAAVNSRDSRMLKGHRGWPSARARAPHQRYPGIRYVMLHTFAHLLIRELALECGYNAASIRERIYASSDSDHPMAGILLYTAAADSDGTLGGLVELGKPENLGRLIDQALARARFCSSDPLCSEHDPGSDRSLHAASCHACTFAAETSCERGNRYLDRTLLIETFETGHAAYFPSGTGPDG